MNWLVYVIPAVVVITVIVIFYRKRSGGPSVQTLGRITDAIMTIQRVAVRNVFPQSKSGAITGINEKQMASQTAIVDDTIRFIYTVEEDEEDYLHIVSSQLVKRKRRRYQIEAMLIVLLALQRQLKECGVKPENVEFDIQESELGTQYVMMKLNEKQNGLLKRKIVG